MIINNYYKLLNKANRIESINEQKQISVLGITMSKTVRYKAETLMPTV